MSICWQVVVIWQMHREESNARFPFALRRGFLFPVRRSKVCFSRYSIVHIGINLLISYSLIVGTVISNLSSIFSNSKLEDIVAQSLPQKKKAQFEIKISVLVSLFFFFLNVFLRPKARPEQKLICHPFFFA